MGFPALGAGLVASRFDSPTFFRFDWLKYFLGFAFGDSILETAAMQVCGQPFLENLRQRLGVLMQDQDYSETAFETESFNLQLTD